MNHPFVLWLIWQNTKTRQRYHIGNLVHEEDKYIFYYENREYRRTLKEAMDHGYKPHVAFPDINKVYTSTTLFGPFARRLPDERRPDFDHILTEHGLSRDYTEMDLLRVTGGRLATDSYEFVSPIYVVNDHFDFDFYIAGWRHYHGEDIIHELKEGQDVYFKMEKDNPEDSKAVIVLSDKNGIKLGYIPAFYSGFMFQAIQNNCHFHAKIEKINYNAKPQLRVYISVEGTLTSNFTFHKNNQDQTLMVMDQ